MNILPNLIHSKKVAYFSMEYAIDQSLKIYAGGLGFLAGSHLRSAYSLKKDLIGIGILWKYGYYDQVRDEEQNMKCIFIKKEYHFLEDTKVKFSIMVNNTQVWVTAYYLPPDTFKSAPLYLLSTDVPENDFLARSIVYRLYDPDTATRIAQSILLGIGGAKLLQILRIEPDVYHLNEGHGLPLVFHLYHKLKNLQDVKHRMVFTTHTPEKAGNEEHAVSLLNKMGFFDSVSIEEVMKINGIHGESLNYTLTALRFSKIANGVSKIHGKVAQVMWSGNNGICPIISISNAQNKEYWMDKKLKEYQESNNNEKFIARKKEFKKTLFDLVADQTGKILDPEVLTIVWARRFTSYKRADLIYHDFNKFLSLVNHPTYPIQVIWAGKPYPEDIGGIQLFNDTVKKMAGLKRCTVLTGYELKLSEILKKGADVWLNTPRYPREASGTSGMTAAMNGTINFSISDGWIPEFAKHGINSFIIPVSDAPKYFENQDDIDSKNLINILENEIIPMYYKNTERWVEVMKAGMKDVIPEFDSDRMINEYYEKMYAYGDD